ncbi:hypothetical protein NP493_1500g00048 [Ridgeia piscesae]|uniref:Uncharacterized protein n=1 Tax=Ridgeia piscesae TaxID=27915 RepID=A0AAD9K2I8_RIDPI|nr:hypothetical protein NP493_1500g00048 [Ridgeia piscesae]
MHSSTMKLKASELPGIMQTMTDMLRDHHQRHGDPAAQPTVRNIQKLETARIDIHDKVVLENERKTWRQVLRSNTLAVQQQSSDVQQNKTDILQLINSNTALAKRLEDMIAQRIEPLESHMNNLRGLIRRQWGCCLLISIVVVFLAMAVALLLQSNGYLGELQEEHGNRINKLEGSL